MKQVLVEHMQFEVGRDHKVKLHSYDNKALLDVEASSRSMTPERTAALPRSSLKIKLLAYVETTHADCAR